MADVVVNITGNASGLQTTLGQIGQQPVPTGNTGSGGRQPVSPPMQPSGGQTPLPGGGTTAMPTYDRLAQDIRREIASRGVVMVPGSSNFNQFMTSVQQQQRDKAYQAIDEKYDYRFETLHSQRKAEEDAIRQKVESERQSALSGITNPIAIRNINESYDKTLQRRLKSVDDKYESEYQRLEQEQAGEIVEVEKRLADVMRDLIDELKRGNPNSYLGQLRSQHREALWKRDNAETEEEVRAASREAAQIEQKISKAMGSQNILQRFGAGWGTFTSIAGVGMNAYQNYLANTGSQIGVLSSAANGDIFAAMEQDLARRKQNSSAWGAGIGGAIGGIGGGVAAAFGSLGIGTGAGIAGGAALGSSIGSWIGSSVFDLMHGDEVNQVKLGSLWSQQEKRLQEYTQLAMMTRGTSIWGNGTGDKNNIDDLRYTLSKMGQKDSFKTEGGLDIYDLGYSSSEASKMIAQRLSQRGFISGGNNFKRSMTADALEKVFNMSNGSLGQLSSYDRYGNDANQDFTNLIASLSRMGTLGMSGGQVLRANEFMGYQQQLLESQKSWMMNPDTNFANRQLLAAQSVYGNSLDSRGIQALSRMNEAITNPAEGMTKVMTYDVIQNLFPETKGNLLEIRKKQYSDDPKVRAEIQKAMFNKLTNVYGDVDTTSGYLALSQYTGIQNPYELQKWVNQMKGGLPEVSEGDIKGSLKGMENYTQSVSKDMLKYTDETTIAISDNLSKLKGVADTMLITFKNELNDIVKELRKINR